MYSSFIKERFERCLDLYLCPRSKKKRVNVDPQSLVPKLPKPQDLQPFPTTLLLRYTGHTARVSNIVLCSLFLYTQCLCNDICHYFMSSCCKHLNTVSSHGDGHVTELEPSCSFHLTCCAWLSGIAAAHRCCFPVAASKLVHRTNDIASITSCRTCRRVWFGAGTQHITGSLWSVAGFCL